MRKLKLTTWKKRVGEREEMVRKRRGEEERKRHKRSQTVGEPQICVLTVHFGVVCYRAIINPNVNKVMEDYRNYIFIYMI